MPIAGLAPARSAGRRRRLALVDRQFANVLGRLDPTTGTDEGVPAGEAALRPARPGRGRAGNIWFTGELRAPTSASSIRRPASVTEYPMPEGVRGPHTPIFDQKGTLFFTLQSGHVGRLMPATGEIKVSKTPSDEHLSVRHPGELEGRARGTCDFRGNRIGSVDPVTMAIRNTRCRSGERGRAASRSRPTNRLVHRLRARLSRPVRSGDRRGEGMAVARRAGVAAVRHRSDRRRVWYSESSVRPNTLVRFDPKTEKFQTWVDSLGRRRGSQHDGDARRQPGARGERREPRRAGLHRRLVERGGGLQTRWPSGPKPDTTSYKTSFSSIRQPTATDDHHATRWCECFSQFQPYTASIIDEMSSTTIGSSCAGVRVGP